MKITRFVPLVILIATSLLAQVAPPKRESRLHHIFTPHHNGDNLEQRFQDVQCSLVLIQSVYDNIFHTGTGFFISADGEVATASHVVGARTWIAQPQNGLYINLALPLTFTVTTSDGKAHPVAASAVQVEPAAFAADVVLVKTGIHPQCWLMADKDDQVKPGQHVITMGFPGLSFGSLALYSGIVSAQLKAGQVDLPVGITANTKQIVKNMSELVRVQMPISGGLSGAPVPNDDNHAIGIVISAGEWSSDLDWLTQLKRTNALDVPQPPDPNQHTVSMASLIAQLAESFHSYASPGYGDAVPMKYLRKGQPVNPQPSPLAH